LSALPTLPGDTASASVCAQPRRGRPAAARREHDHHQQTDRDV